MYTKQEIILQNYREGKSQREISRKLGISRKTVRKYLTEYETIKKGGATQNQLTPFIATPPQYNTGLRSKTVLTGQIKAQIDVLL